MPDEHSRWGEVIRTNLSSPLPLCRPLYNYVPCLWTAHFLYNLFALMAALTRHSAFFSFICPHLTLACATQRMRG